MRLKSRARRRKDVNSGTCARSSSKEHARANCGRSHDFHDEDNKQKTVELGFEKKTNPSLRSLVAGSSLQANSSMPRFGCEYRHRVKRSLYWKTRMVNYSGARVNSRKKMCLYYPEGSCKSHNTCHFWHVCKGYIEGDCQGDCGLSHDFHDDSNVKKTSKLGLEKHPSGTVRKIVANSLPQVCLMYQKNECRSSHECPYLHICPLVVQGNYCSCSLSHELTDDHNMRILKQYDLAPQQTKLNIVQCNILMPKPAKKLWGGLSFCIIAHKPIWT
ncbi:Zinc finger CCCH-type antiviral protein 1-like [Desmophyllum pertusum]|uniref:Zinc finger CCCH-type antiviral protein 1-like n=1 Tax=Desmophyllum pertusum TaxID=174260 RepID=A0A9W9YGB2_9CNID|nr:Zinc finger CCCH-type antiviral protein 1-like [Desmophyllum pertusum]